MAIGMGGVPILSVITPVIDKVERPGSGNPIC